ncbi:MAG: hypothetical protein JWL99_1700 [Streptomyces oryziradicis]|nr:hypothetical protein [Actinacidiphila oryziradicis]
MALGEPCGLSGVMGAGVVATQQSRELSQLPLAPLCQRPPHGHHRGAHASGRRARRRTCARRALAGTRSASFPSGGGRDHLRDSRIASRPPEAPGGRISSLSSRSLLEVVAFFDVCDQSRVRWQPAEAHPVLRDEREKWWWRLPHKPAENRRLAVVHAWRRSLAEIAGSLARRMGGAAREGAPRTRGDGLLPEPTAPSSALVRAGFHGCGIPAQGSSSGPAARFRAGEPSLIQVCLFLRDRSVPLG